MPTHVVIFETERADYRDPLFASVNSAAMANLSLYYGPGEDPIQWIPDQMPGIIEHLEATPVHLRCLYPVWFGVYEYRGDIPTFNTAAPIQQAQRIADTLRAVGYGRGSIPYL